MSYGDSRMKNYKLPIVKARQLIEELQVDALLVINPINIRYLSGFTGSAAQLILTRNKNYLITDFRYVEQAGTQCPDYEIVKIGVPSYDYQDAWNDILEKDALAILGYEDQVMTVQQYQSYLKHGIQKELVPAGNQLDLLRVQKEQWEIDLIAKAEAIGDQAFEHILGYIKPGMTEIDIALELEFFMRKQGAEGLSFETIVASGVHSSMPHAYPRNKAIVPGDFITMDFGCVYEGYCSDMTRTIVLGKANKKQKKIYQLVLDAQQAALEIIHAGQVGKSVDQVARDVISSAGYGDRFGHGLGHGVGLYIHEEPRYSMKCESLVLENSVMSVEPGIYIPGWGGVRIEDLIVVKQEGYENLTHSPKHFIEL